MISSLTLQDPVFKELKNLLKNLKNLNFNKTYAQNLLKTFLRIKYLQTDVLIQEK